MIKSLMELPLLAAYLKQVGAQPVNFRRADVVETVGKYPKTIGSIKIFPDGSIATTGQVAPPSKDEAEAIAEEYREADKPKPVALTALGNDLPPGVIIDNKTSFLCHDFKGQIVMIQQRVELPDGKAYIPWTYWNDGEWRKMEPEGTMPFYGLEGAKEHSVLFIHEGAKAAAKIKRLLSGEESAAGFPWLEDMRWGAHVAWLGGVHALHRSDWEGLAKLGWKKVVIIADNDPMGKAVVPRISEHFSCPTFALIFSDEWPHAFDMADDWPSEMFTPEGHYIGSPIDKLMQPATWATDKVQILDDNGRPKTTHVIRQTFAEQWSWAAEQDLMINVEMPRYRYPAPKFNAAVRPYSHVPNTTGLLQKHFTGGISTVTYNPALDARVIQENSGLLAINLYEPSTVRPVPGDWGPWDEFLEYLIPNEGDRKQIRRWMATLIARPDIRMIYGLLLMSETQGIGKTTLGSILADLVGRANSSFPGENMIVGSEFNGWVANKRLIIVNEIYSGHSWKAYNRLKPYVSDDVIEVNIKHQTTYTQPNWCHFVLCSNSPAALKLEASDRRWLVPMITETPWAKDKFQAFHTWLRKGGLAHIAHWAATYEQRKEGQYVGPGEIAPMSARKARLIDESRSEAEQLLLALAEQMQSLGDPIAVPLGWLREWAEESQRGTVYETPQAIGRIMRQAGLWLTDERVKLEGSKQYLVLNQEAMKLWAPAKLRDAIRKPTQLLQEEF